MIATGLIGKIVRGSFDTLNPDFLEGRDDPRMYRVRKFEQGRCVVAEVDAHGTLRAWVVLHDGLIWKLDYDLHVIPDELERPLRDV